jgi:hypothetical protein
MENHVSMVVPLQHLLNVQSVMTKNALIELLKDESG